MCIATPGRIVEIDPAHPAAARVDVGGVRRNVNLAMLDDPSIAVGDWVALHLGFAIERLTEAQAREALAFAENDPFGTLLADLETEREAPVPGEVGT